MITDINDRLISNAILDLYFTQDAMKVRNRLLDGTYHVQSIGKALKIANIECEIFETGKSYLDNCYNRDGPVVLIFEGIRYVGHLEKEVDWRILVKGKANIRRYGARFKLAIDSEGAI